jgi:hypothetical protein
MGREAAVALRRCGGPTATDAAQAQYVPERVTHASAAAAQAAAAAAGAQPAMARAPASSGAAGWGGSGATELLAVVAAGSREADADGRRGSLGSGGTGGSSCDDLHQPVASDQWEWLAAPLPRGEGAACADSGSRGLCSGPGRAMEPAVWNPPQLDEGWRSRGSPLGLDKCGPAWPPQVEALVEHLAGRLREAELGLEEAR